jgi:hypothetical protein
VKRSWLWLVILFLPLMARAQNCPGLSYSQSPVDNNASDTTGHYTGDHVFAGTASDTCEYSSFNPPQKYCETENQAVILVEQFDTGTLSTYPLGYHVGHASTTDGQAVGLSDTTYTATAVGEGAWEWCLASSCSFSVTSDPISVPSSSTWSHTQNTAFTCAIKTDPGPGEGGGGGGGGCPDVTTPPGDPGDPGGGGGCDVVKAKKGA